MNQFEHSKYICWAFLCLPLTLRINTWSYKLRNKNFSQWWCVLSNFCLSFFHVLYSSTTRSHKKNSSWAWMFIGWVGNPSWVIWTRNKVFWCQCHPYTIFSRQLTFLNKTQKSRFFKRTSSFSQASLSSLWPVKI